jgi:hypothetical protein
MRQVCRPGWGRRADSTQRTGRRGPHTQQACSSQEQSRAPGISQEYTWQACSSWAHSRRLGWGWTHSRLAGSPRSSWCGTWWRGGWRWEEGGDVWGSCSGQLLYQAWVSQQCRIWQCLPCGDSIMCAPTSYYLGMHFPE